MDDPFQIQRELRYGAPVCDQILAGRYFTIGYSWYFRQAKWVLEIINPNSHLMTDVERKDKFRADLRMPRRFRAGLGNFEGSGYDRGHLAASANHDELEVQNSETFLLSNMSPQVPEFNRGKWKKLEAAIRTLDADKNTLETYVLTAPVFDFRKEIKTLGDRKNKFGIDVPIPHYFVKSVLAEKKSGALWLWTFMMPNEDIDGTLEDYLIKTYDAEQYVGGRFWDRVSGGDLHSQKKKPRKIWKY